MVSSDRSHQLSTRIYAAPPAARVVMIIIAHNSTSLFVPNSKRFGGGKEMMAAGTHRVPPSVVVRYASFYLISLI